MKFQLNKNQSIFSVKQSGAALFVSLVILLVLTVIGLSAARRSTLQEKMASNLHVKNLAFNAAESAIGGFVVDSHLDGRLLPGHVLFDIGNVVGNTSEYCYDNTGTGVACGAVQLDSDHGNAITSKVIATVLTYCGVCPGYSLGDTGSTGCIDYQLDSTGTVATQSESTTLFAFEVVACY